MRPRKRRHINFNPDITYFKPRGMPLAELDEVELGHDEIEAIRLKDLKGLNQKNCAQKMKISQSTFQRILSSAHQKIAKALIMGWAIRIKEGRELSTVPIENLDVIVISDNNEYKEGLETAWGFSAFVKGAEKTILFDTGVNGPILLRNMKKLNIKPKDVDIVVLSHIHEDHVGGLKSFMGEKSSITVYVPLSFPTDFKKNVRNLGTKVIEVEGASEIFENVYSTGEFRALPKEQSLIIQTGKGLIIITGCAHPGIVNIIEKAKELVQNDILLVMGGFHLRDKSENEIKSVIASFKKLGVCFVAPCHCSGDLARQLFKEQYRENFINAGVGRKITMHDLTKF